MADNNKQNYKGRGNNQHSIGDFREQERGARHRMLKRIAWWTFGLGAIGIIVWFLATGVPNNQMSTTDVTKICVQHGGFGMHIHPILRIVINGEDQTIPTNIGVPSSSCMRPLHTHDETGTIHIESKEVRDFQLKDFFSVWEKPFSPEQIFDYKADEAHQVRITINGVESNEFENAVMRDGDQIVIYYEEIP